MDGLVSPATGAEANNGMDSEDKSRYRSPVLPSSSMTPPPSSQIPGIERSEVHTPKAIAPFLSSPPPTVKSNLPTAPSFGRSLSLSHDQVTSASTEELKGMIRDMEAELRDARTSAAHYKLQYNMLYLESSEASNRMAVELDMAQREVELLQERGQQHSGTIKDGGLSMFSPESATYNIHVMKDLEDQYKLLRIENEELKVTLERAGNLVEQRENTVLALKEDNERLRDRIRKNREHMNRLFDNIYDQSPRTTFGASPTTPVRQRGTNTAKVPMSEPQPRKEQPFAALLLADKVLSQEINNGPSMRTRTFNHPNQSRHHRGSQSLSSLPSTPSRTRNSNTLRSTQFQTPVFQPINKTPQTAPPAHHLKRNRTRRDSTDSTISASSVEKEERFLRKDEIEESQASRAATSLLRRSREVKRSMEHASYPSKKAAAVQAKISGQTAKSNFHQHALDRRSLRQIEGIDHPPLKKSRTEGVGLGIRDVAAS